MNPTPRQAAEYRGGFFTSRVGSADRIIYIALHPRSKLRSISGNVIKKDPGWQFLNNTFKLY